MKALTLQLEAQNQTIERQTAINAKNGEMLAQILVELQQQRGVPMWLIKLLVLAVLALSGVNVANFVGVI